MIWVMHMWSRPSGYRPCPVKTGCTSMQLIRAIWLSGHSQPITEFSLQRAPIGRNIVLKRLGILLMSFTVRAREANLSMPISLDTLRKAALRPTPRGIAKPFY